MSRRRSLVLVVAVACGGADLHDTAAPGGSSSDCPSTTAPDRCRELAASAAASGHSQLAWAYTVLECQSQTATQCGVMWKQYAKLAPTQTDALNVLHVACDHSQSACEQLTSWHLEHGHPLAAAAYRKRAEAARSSHGEGSAAPPTRSASALALATDLAAVMHVSGAPRTDAIDQMVVHEQSAPIAPATHAAAKPKAWPMHAGAGTHSDGCAADATLDRHQVPLDKCILEVRPFDGDQIALLNHCSNPVNVAYIATRSSGSPVTNQLRLDRFEARSIGLSHHDVGTLTYAVCSDGCRVTGGDTTAWSSTEAIYNCSK